MSSASPPPPLYPLSCWSSSFPSAPTNRPPGSFCSWKTGSCLQAFAALCCLLFLQVRLTPHRLQLSAQMLLPSEAFPDQACLPPSSLSSPSALFLSLMLCHFLIYPSPVHFLSPLTAPNKARMYACFALGCSPRT